MDSVVGSILKEAFKKRREITVGDETIYDFINRRFNQHVALNLIGAITHGIYAGDCKTLSVQSTFPLLAACEDRYGSVVKGMMKGGVPLDTEKEQQLAQLCQSKNPEWQQEMKGASVIGLLPGLESLPKALRHYLTNQPNVDLLTNHSVNRLELSSPITTVSKTTVRTNGSSISLFHLGVDNLYEPRSIQVRSYHCSITFACFGIHPSRRHSLTTLDSQSQRRRGRGELGIQKIRMRYWAGWIWIPDAAPGCTPSKQGPRSSRCHIRQQQFGQARRKQRHCTVYSDDWGKRLGSRIRRHE